MAKIKHERAWLIWNNGPVGTLARTIYAEDRFGGMPILADALTAR